MQFPLKVIRDGRVKPHHGAETARCVGHSESFLGGEHFRQHPLHLNSLPQFAAARR
jgi:hypothetical protein